MNTKHLLTILLLMGIFPLPAQEIQYNLWVKAHKTNEVEKGILVGLEDSSITFAQYRWDLDARKQIDITNISSLKFREKNKLVRGFFLGALAGFGGGAVAGLISGDDQGGFIAFTAGQKALILGTVLTLPASLLGGLLSLPKISFDIHGDQSNYNKTKEALDAYRFSRP